MEAERLIKDYEHEKHQERKRKGAHLEAIFEQAVKKSTQDNNENNNKDRTTNTENENMLSGSSPKVSPYSTTFENAAKPSANSRNSSGNAGNSLGTVVSSYGDTGNPIAIPRCSPGRNVSPSGDTENALRNTRNTNGNTGNRMEHARNLSGISGRPLEKANNSSENTSGAGPYENDYDLGCNAQESERESPEGQIEGSEGNRYTGLKQIQESSSGSSSAEEPKSSEFQSTVTIKQEKSDDPPPVQIMPVRSQVEREKRPTTEDSGEIGEDCLKFLLFSGKLYHCERISDLTHSFSRFIGDSVLGRKGNTFISNLMKQGV